MLHSPALRLLALTGALAACSGPDEDISSWAHACHIHKNGDTTKTGTRTI